MRHASGAAQPTGIHSQAWSMRPSVGGAVPGPARLARGASRRSGESSPGVADRGRQQASRQCAPSACGIEVPHERTGGLLGAHEPIRRGRSSCERPKTDGRRRPGQRTGRRAARIRPLDGARMRDAPWVQALIAPAATFPAPAPDGKSPSAQASSSAGRPGFVIAEERDAGFAVGRTAGRPQGPGAPCARRCGGNASRRAKSSRSRRSPPVRGVKPGHQNRRL